MRIAALPEHLFIEARLCPAAGLELSARLLAARPHWDIELDEERASFAIDLVRGELDGELLLLEEALGQLERVKNIEITDFWVRRRAEAPSPAPPASAGPWRLHVLPPGEEPPPPRPDRLCLPFGLSASARFWASESLLLSLAAEHFTPQPGAPETRGRAMLALGHVLPLAPTAALLAGCGEAVLISDGASGERAQGAAALNGKRDALACFSEDFALLAKKMEDWQGRFGLISVHLSPYLAIRRLKVLAGWLAEDGVLIISGFAPGPQTAQLLRAAAKCGLALSASNTEGAWAAMKLEPAPAGEDLPPLTGSVVPALMEAPLETRPEDGEEIPDEESLMLDEEEMD